MHARNENNGFGFTYTEAARSLPEAERDRGKAGPSRAANSPNALPKNLRAWCATNATNRNIPLPPIEEALVLLNQDRLLVENVLNTAEQLGFGPMTIVESILERRG